MSEVIMYTSATCGYCIQAEALLNKKGVKVIKYRIDQDQDKLKEMMVRANGARTVPQIFIDDFHVGGCDDLYELDGNGKLDPLLAK